MRTGSERVVSRLSGQEIIEVRAKQQLSGGPLDSSFQPPHLWSKRFLTPPDTRSIVTRRPMIAAAR